MQTTPITAISLFTPTADFIEANAAPVQRGQAIAAHRRIGVLIADANLGPF